MYWSKRILVGAIVLAGATFSPFNGTQAETFKPTGEEIAGVQVRIGGPGYRYYRPYYRGRHYYPRPYYRGYRPYYRHYSYPGRYYYPYYYDNYRYGRPRSGVYFYWK